MAISTAGLLVSGYALGVVAGAPGLIVARRRVPPRRDLLTLMIRAVSVMSNSVELTDALGPVDRRRGRRGDTRYAVAVVDVTGYLKAFARQDGAPPHAVQVVQDKAYTAAGSGMSAQQRSDMLADNPRMAVGAASGIARLVALGGRVPLGVEGRLIGAVRVSGGRYRDDTRVAGAVVREAERAAQSVVTV